LRVLLASRAPRSVARLVGQGRPRFAIPIPGASAYSLSTD